MSEVLRGAPQAGSPPLGGEGAEVRSEGPEPSRPRRRDGSLGAPGRPRVREKGRRAMAAGRAAAEFVRRLRVSATPV